MSDQAPPQAATPAAVSRLRIERRPTVSSRRGRQRRRWLIVAVLIVIVAVAAFLMPRRVDVQTTSVVTTYPSQRFVQLTASGYVVAQRRAAVASKGTGRLVELRVREGSIVKHGELLARLDASDVEASVRAAQAAVKQSQAGLRQAEANVRQAEADEANAQADLKRNNGLVEQGFVSPQALDSVRTKADASRATVAAARASVTAAQAGIAQARAQLQVQKVNEEYAEIRAPFDGVVLVKNANVGDIITPFSSAAGSLGSVVTMADMSTLEVEADVSESSLGKASIGQPVEITLDALPDARFRGKVLGIVPTVDRAKATVMTKIQFEKLDARILPEMSAKVAFLSQPASDADQKAVLAANPAAIVERDGHRQVFRIVGDSATVEAITVEPGRTLGDLVELKGPGAPPLKSGDKLVLKPPASLAAGAKVQVASP